MSLNIETEASKNADGIITISQVSTDWDDGKKVLDVITLTAVEFEKVARQLGYRVDWIGR